MGLIGGTRNGNLAHPSTRKQQHIVEDGKSIAIVACFL